MKKIFFLIKIIVIFAFLSLTVESKESNYLTKGIELFKKKEFDKSKIFFERDLAFNPRSEKSSLYLAKIFNKKENENEEEINLNNVLILNPKNDEAVYMLTLLKIKRSNYEEAQELINTFNLICKSFCSKKNEIEEKLEKIIPKNAENKN